MTTFVPYTIRSLTPEDQPFLYEMMYQSIFIPEGETLPPRDVVQQPAIRKYVETFGRPGDLGFAAIDDETGGQIGAAWARLLAAEEHGYGFVDEATPELVIALLPAYRGQGIGTALMARLMAAAQGRYPAISLSVWPANPAYRLYLRLGFEVVEEKGSAVTMVKNLNG